MIESSRQNCSLRLACDALDVTMAGYFAHVERQHQPTDHQLQDDALAQHIVAAHERSEGTYGSVRIDIELRDQGIRSSRRRIDRIRCNLGLVAKQPVRFVRTTDSDHDSPIAPNVLQRKFVAAQPNTIWVSDITYIRAASRWMFLCVIIDTFANVVVGRTLSHQMDASIVTTALKRAIALRRPSPGLIFHSDRGAQYASDDVVALIEHHHIKQSMSRKGDCWDNALAESFFSRLKTEAGATFADDFAAGEKIYNYIDTFYNKHRIHTRLRTSPEQFERIHRAA